MADYRPAIDQVCELLNCTPGEVPEHVRAVVKTLFDLACGIETYVNTGNAMDLNRALPKAWAILAKVKGKRDGIQRV